ncbi:hypothetical protein Sango_1139100 [Sesamum angolense]|uniref:Transposase-associated domain-containing protein n=1 Tax=Sesamum angolense TaxID=2727404 RepID=A0AAE1WVC5_9LAMI|nr:hypothetical protein Sango_1139100 [Sesamum angolense]
MYEKNLQRRACLTLEFEIDVIAFIEWVKSQHTYMEGDTIKCPCRKCKNEVLKTPNEVSFDLYMKDFMEDIWTGDMAEEEGVLRGHHYFPAGGANSCCSCGGGYWYKPTKERYPNHKKTPYVILRHFDQTYPILQQSLVRLDWICSRIVYVPGNGDPCPSNAKHLIDVYLELLIEELQNLWHMGLLMDDNAKKETFTTRAVLMRTMDDLPAYGITSG